MSEKKQSYGGGSGSSELYVVEARTSTRPFRCMGGMTLTGEWQRVHFIKSPIGIVSLPMHPLRTDCLELFTFEAAMALAHWFLTLPNDESSIPFHPTGIEARLVRVQLNYSYSTKELSVGESFSYDEMEKSMKWRDREQPAPPSEQAIAERYVKHGIQLRDANSGFEPHTFTEDVYNRWKPLINAGGGPWRFAFDDMKEAKEVRAVFKILQKEPSRRKRVYVLIGNEPFDACMERVYETIANGCEPHCQPWLDLTAMTREPRARFDWTVQQLKDVARWANGFLWRKIRFDEYDRTASKRKTAREQIPVVVNLDAARERSVSKWSERCWRSDKT